MSVALPGSLQPLPVRVMKPGEATAYAGVGTASAMAGMDHAAALATVRRLIPGFGSWRSLMSGLPLLSGCDGRFVCSANSKGSVPDPSTTNSPPRSGGNRSCSVTQDAERGNRHSRADENLGLHQVLHRLGNHGGDVDAGRRFRQLPQRRLLHFVFREDRKSVV